MAKLNLNFLDKHDNKNQTGLYTILENCGKEIVNYASDYFSYIVTTTTHQGIVVELSLYIIAPEIKYDYRVLNIEFVSEKTIKIYFFTLLTKQVEQIELDISNGYSDVEVKVSELLSTGLFNESLRFLINQIFLKREYKKDE